MTPHRELKGELVRVEGMGSGLKLGLGVLWLAAGTKSLGRVWSYIVVAGGAGVEVVGGGRAGVEGKKVEA